MGRSKHNSQLGAAYSDRQYSEMRSKGSRISAKISILIRNL